MPPGYSATDITKITPAARGTRPAPGEAYFREGHSSHATFVAQRSNQAMERTVDRRPAPLLR